MLTPGDRIGDWEVVLPLGQGGMGSVFRCRHALSHRIEAAVKVLKPTEVSGARERFIREAEALHALSHPAIVRVHGFGQDASTGLLWLAMELVHGQNFEFLLQDGHFPRDKVAEIFAPVAEGLAYAHSRGIVHRDIKPANLMLRADGRAVVLDFGIAVQEGHDRLTQEGVVPGTVAYAAPEQVTFGTSSDPALADVYALGQVLSECLTGRFTFPRDPDQTEQRRAVRILKKKLRMGPIDPGQEVPDPMRELVLTATHPDPGKRGPPFARWPSILKGRSPHATAEPTGLRAAEPSPESAVGFVPPQGVFSADDIDLDESSIQSFPPALSKDLALPEPPGEVAPGVDLLDADTQLHEPAEDEDEDGGSGIGWILVGVASSVVLAGLVVFFAVAAAGGAAWWTLSPTPDAPEAQRPLRGVLQPDKVEPVAEAPAAEDVPAPGLATPPPPTSPPTRLPAREPPASVGGEPAKLVIGADRAAIVYVDGEKLRTTPVTRRLAAGSYRIELDAGASGKKSFTVDVEPGETARRIWDFGDGEWRSFDGGLDERSLPPRPRLSGIERKIRAMPSVGACLEGHTGAATVRFVVVPDGTIAADGIEPTELAGSALEQCLFRAIRTLQLEPSRAGAVVRVQVSG